MYVRLFLYPYYLKWWIKMNIIWAFWLTLQHAFTEGGSDLGAYVLEVSSLPWQKGGSDLKGFCPGGLCPPFIRDSIPFYCVPWHQISFIFPLQAEYRHPSDRTSSFVPAWDRLGAMLNCKPQDRVCSTECTCINVCLSVSAQLATKCVHKQYFCRQPIKDSSARNSKRHAVSCWTKMRCLAYARNIRRFRSAAAGGQPVWSVAAGCGPNGLWPIADRWRHCNEQQSVD